MIFIRILAEIGLVIGILLWNMRFWVNVNKVYLLIFCTLSIPMFLILRISSKTNLIRVLCVDNNTNNL